jgi:hypothetical protein
MASKMDWGGAVLGVARRGADPSISMRWGLSVGQTMGMWSKSGRLLVWQTLDQAKIVRCVRESSCW